MKDINFKTAKSSDLKQKKLLTQQLEEENKKMENRLQELRMAMTKEKEERSCGGGYWNKGKPGAVLTYKPEETKPTEKNSSKMKKIAILKDEQLVIPKRPVVPGTMAYIAQQKDIKLPEPIPLSKKFLKCGQCETKQASVMCQECGEDYCAKCFASFHLRGALKKHRSIPISGFNSFRRSSLVEANETEVSTPSTLKGDSFRETSATSDSNKSSPKKSVETSNQADGAFRNIDMNGTYDEAQQTREFQRAVLEWRNLGKPMEPTINENGEYSADCSTSTETPHSPAVSNSENILANAIKQIQFKHSLSYAEQLMLKKHRREEQHQEVEPKSDLVMFHGSTPRNGYGPIDSNNHNFSGVLNGESEENDGNILCNGNSTPYSPRNGSFKIEEISTELNSARSQKTKPQKIPKEKMNERHRKSPEPRELAESSPVIKRPLSSRLPNTPRSKMGMDFERPISRAKTRADFHHQKGHLTGKPSVALSEIAAMGRGILLPGFEEQSWLTLDVDIANQHQTSTAQNNSEKEKRPSSARSSASTTTKKKLSYRFYQIGPKSWKPDRSLIPDGFEPRSIPEAWSADSFKNILLDPSAPLSNSEALEEIHRISSMTTPRVDSSNIIEYITPRRLRSAHGRPLPPKKPKSSVMIKRPHSAREFSSFKGIVVEGDDMTRFDSLHPGEKDEDRQNAVELFKELTLENMTSKPNIMSLDLYDSLDLDRDSSDCDTLRKSVESENDFNCICEDDLNELDTSRYKDKEDVESLR